VRARGLQCSHRCNACSASRSAAKRKKRAQCGSRQMLKVSHLWCAAAAINARVRAMKMAMSAVIDRVTRKARPVRSVWCGKHGVLTWGYVKLLPWARKVATWGQACCISWRRTNYELRGEEPYRHTYLYCPPQGGESRRRPRSAASRLQLWLMGCRSTEH